MQRVLPVGMRAWLEKKIVRFLTYAAAKAPWTWEWSGARYLMRGIFDPLAATWHARVAHDDGWGEPLAAGLREVVGVPRRALDIGTGTGLGAALIAHRFPQTDVTGADISPAMIEAARTLHAELPNLRFVVADAARLPFNDAGFDLVTCLNVPVFFAELARVTSPGGCALIAFSLGEDTPIFLPTEELERKLRAHGFPEVRRGRAGAGVWTLAVRESAGDGGRGRA